ncbi:hypothetical protein Hdeb2414_s0010g00334091 [Helianthus debilis subsp. tardiflorus]
MNSICYYCFHCNSSDDALENQEFDAQLAPLIDFTYKCDRNIGVFSSSREGCKKRKRGQNCLEEPYVN